MSYFSDLLSCGTCWLDAVSQKKKNKIRWRSHVQVLVKTVVRISPKYANTWHSLVGLRFQKKDDVNVRDAVYFRAIRRPKNHITQRHINVMLEDLIPTIRRWTLPLCEFEFQICINIEYYDLIRCLSNMGNWIGRTIKVDL